MTRAELLALLAADILGLRLGSVNAAVAQHDWIHLLADYGTTPLGEIEVIGFQTAASRTPGAMLGMVGAIDRLAEAVARGADCTKDLLLDVDFFEIADEPLDQVRARFGVAPKSSRTLELDPYGALQLPPSAQ